MVACKIIAASRGSHPLNYFFSFRVTDKIIEDEMPGGALYFKEKYVKNT